MFVFCSCPLLQKKLWLGDFSRAEATAFLKKRTDSEAKKLPELSEQEISGLLDVVGPRPAALARLTAKDVNLPLPELSAQLDVAVNVMLLQSETQLSRRLLTQLLLCSRSASSAHGSIQGRWSSSALLRGLPQT